MKSTRETSMKKAHAILKSIGYIAMILLVPLVCGEIFVRLFIPQWIMPRFVESAPWGIRKNLPDVDGIHDTPEFKYPVRTNSQGFRGNREFESMPAPNAYRIVILGDSVSFGYGVEEEKTFSAVLERKLRVIGVNAEVINMSVSGFGTAEQLIQYENVGMKYHPQLVILGYFTNDPLNNAVSRLYDVQDGKLIRQKTNFQPGIIIRDRLHKVPFYTFLSQHSHLLNFFREKISGIILRKYAKNAVEDARPGVSGLSGKEKVLTVLLLSELAQKVTASGAKFIVVDIPDKDLDPNLPREGLKGLDLTIVDVVGALDAAAKSGEKLYYDVDSHPNSKGHEIIAQEIFNKIRVHD